MGIKRIVSIRLIDLWGSEPLESKKMKQKMQKTEMSIFPLYFWTNAFVKKTTILDTVPVHGFQFHFLRLFTWTQPHIFDHGTNTFVKKNVFQHTLLHRQYSLAWHITDISLQDEYAAMSGLYLPTVLYKTVPRIEMGGMSLFMNVIGHKNIWLKIIFDWNKYLVI